jgi:hypothetical protein
MYYGYFESAGNIRIINIYLLIFWFKRHALMFLLKYIVVHEVTSQVTALYDLILRFTSCVRNSGFKLHIFILHLTRASSKMFMSSVYLY